MILIKYHTHSIKFPKPFNPTSMHDSIILKNIMSQPMCYLTSASHYGRINTTIQISTHICNGSIPQDPLQTTLPTSNNHLNPTSPWLDQVGWSNHSTCHSNLSLMVNSSINLQMLSFKTLDFTQPVVKTPSLPTQYPLTSWLVKLVNLNSKPKWLILLV